ncbi:MAG: hypothetical protein ACK6BC_14110 [Cyanobacteriota bacterium]
MTPWLQRRSLNVIPLTTKVVRYAVGHGCQSHVTLQWCKGLHWKDATTRAISPLTKPMCLIKEEVRGEKVEREIVLPPGSASLQLIPGGVFATQELLKSGQFKYHSWAERKPYQIHGIATHAQQTIASVAAEEGGGSSEYAATQAIQSLIRPANFFGTPNRSSSSEMRWSTFQDSMGLNIGGSFFYLGFLGERPFSFSAEKYRYMYVYTFEQTFLSATVDRPSQPEDLFCTGTTFDEDDLFLQEVKYGRRLHVIIESEYPLERCFNSLHGGLEWIVIAAKLQQSTFAKKASKHIKIRIQSQDGKSYLVTNYSQLQSMIDGYFQSICDQNPISPLSYKVSDLAGVPVSLLTTACLDGQQCLTSPKARVLLKEVKLCGPANNRETSSEEIYGSISLHLYNEFGKQIYRDGQSIEPRPGLCQIPAGTILVAGEEAPLKLVAGQPQRFGANEQEKYIDVDITNLDMIFQVEPLIKKKTDTGYHIFTSATVLKKNLRQMLIEGSMGTTFQCRHNQWLLELSVDIQPL